MDSKQDIDKNNLDSINKNETDKSDTSGSDNFEIEQKENIKIFKSSSAVKNPKIHDTKEEEYPEISEKEEEKNQEALEEEKAGNQEILDEKEDERQEILDKEKYENPEMLDKETDENLDDLNIEPENVLNKPKSSDISPATDLKVETDSKRSIIDEIGEEIEIEPKSQVAQLIKQKKVYEDKRDYTTGPKEKISDESFEKQRLSILHADKMKGEEHEIEGYVDKSEGESDEGLNKIDQKGSLKESHILPSLDEPRKASKFLDETEYTTGPQEKITDASLEEQDRLFNLYADVIKDKLEEKDDEMREHDDKSEKDDEGELDEGIDDIDENGSHIYPILDKPQWPKEASILEPEPRAQSMEHIKIYENIAARGPTETSDLEPKPQAKAMAQARIYEDKAISVSHAKSIEQSQSSAKLSSSDVSKLQDLRRVSTFLKDAYQEGSKSTDLLLKDQVKIVTEPKKEDLEGLSGPTEPPTFEPEPQADVIKQTKIFSGLTDIGPTESPDFEPTPRLEEAKQQKIYDVRVDWKVEEKTEEKQPQTWEEKSIYGLRGPTEPKHTEPTPMDGLIKQGRVYAGEAVSGPTEAEYFEPEIQGRAVKQTRIRFVGKDSIETDLIEPVVHKVDSKKKLSDRMEYLARPKKNFIDRLLYKRFDGTLPENPLPYWVVMPLSNKIPAGPYPYEITLKKLNRDLYLPPTGQKMDLNTFSKNDPVETYRSLYDPALKDYFKKKKNYLKRQGFITKTGRVRCTLKDINDYRAYTRRLVAEEIHKKYRDDEKERQEEIEQEERDRLERAEKREIAKNTVTQTMLRTRIKDMVSTIKEGSMEDQVEMDRKILNAQIRRQKFYRERALAKQARYNLIYNKHAESKFKDEEKLRKEQLSVIRDDIDRLERLSRLKELEKLEKDMRKADFYERRIASQYEWLQEGFRLDAKYRKLHDARVAFQRENRRPPQLTRPEDQQELINKIYLLSKQEEQAEDEMIKEEEEKEEESQSESDLQTRDGPQISHDPIRESPNEEEVARDLLDQLLEEISSANNKSGHLSEKEVSESESEIEE